MNSIIISGHVVKRPQPVKNRNGEDSLYRSIMTVRSKRIIQRKRGADAQALDDFVCVIETKYTDIKAGDPVQVIGTVAMVPHYADRNCKKKGRQPEYFTAVVLVDSLAVLTKRDRIKISAEEKEKAAEYDKIMESRRLAKIKREARKAADELIDSMGDDGYV